ncbi:hypothetical protein C8Q76DRAFT_757319 [Earliella scabrosa]|nr:hypothetical protein C8Q76DRAFT_757319 [Earliella scabrosa]
MHRYGTRRRPHGHVMRRVFLLLGVGRLTSPRRQCARDETTNAVIRVASYIGASVWRWCPSAPTMWSARHRRMVHCSWHGRISHLP